MYLFSNFIVYFLCLCCFCCFVGDWELKGQSERFSGKKKKKKGKIQQVREVHATTTQRCNTELLASIKQKLSIAVLAF